jgi:hypothetical protein
MYYYSTDLQADSEDLVAELAEAAYGFALRHGFRGTFVEVELGLWHALRSCQGRIQEFASASLPTGSSSGPDLPVPPPTRQGTHDEAAPALARH